MPQISGRAERIDLLQADDPRDVVHRAVACLAQGGVVGLPTDSSYALAASALDTKAVSRLRTLKAASDGRPLALGLREPDEIIDWVPDASALGRKLARRVWPGPVTLVFDGAVERGLVQELPAEVRQIVAPGTSIGLRLPGHDLVREILDLVPGPLVISAAPGRDGAAPHSADPVAEMVGLDMVLDAGPGPKGARNTVVAIDPTGFRVVREGLVEADFVRKMSGTILLFVCTGNTCRSPMAEALCRLLLAERLRCDPHEVEARGFVVASAGIAAGHGMRAAVEAMTVVQSRGGSLRNHASRQVSPAMIAQSDLILAMTRDHRDALLDEFPEAEPRVRLLHARGGDIADPIGMDRDTYRRTAEAIEDHLQPILDELWKAARLV